MKLFLFLYSVMFKVNFILNLFEGSFIMSKKIIIFLVSGILIACTAFYILKQPVLTPPEAINKTDDWKYSGESYSYSDSSTSSLGLLNSQPSTNSGSIKPNYSTPSKNYSVTTESTNLGYSVGGAKDINNFRENLKNGYLPLTTDITHEGIFYGYTFDTGKTEESTELFSPSYSYAVSKDPISGEEEYYLSVGLNSNIKESDFSRKKLNLVILLDISGSMASSFNSYYYDNPFNLEDENKSKMEIANESLNLLIDNLNDDDRLGIVLFESSAHLAKPLNLISETDVDAIKEHILEIEATGGTNFEDGYIEATKLFEEYSNSNQDEYENRIIILTDAMPNTGTTSRNGLLNYVKKNAKNNIYTTFIGIGVDFNTDLTETLGTVTGANYYSVHNSKEFKTRMDEEFEYMVTPLVFDLEMNLESEGYEIEAIYGTTGADKDTGNIMYVNTLFPSASTDTGEVKGGLILLKLSKKDIENEEITLNVSYKDRNGKKYSNSKKVNIDTSKIEYYPNTGIRKGIVLTRYVNVLKNWIMYEKSYNNSFLIKEDGITDFDLTENEIMYILGEHERQSIKSTVSDEYKETLNKFKEYLENEVKLIGDEDLQQEIDILNLLLKK